MNKFVLYIISETNSWKATFHSEELCNCLSYIKTNSFMPSRCMIISPNGRRITFNPNGAIIFGDIPVKKVST